MIKGKCIPFDSSDKDEKFPTVFARVPVEGENVISEGGTARRIISVTHGQILLFGDTMEYEPFVILQLDYI